MRTSHEPQSAEPCLAGAEKLKAAVQAGEVEVVDEDNVRYYVFKAGLLFQLWRAAGLRLLLHMAGDAREAHARQEGHVGGRLTPGGGPGPNNNLHMDYEVSSRAQDINAISVIVQEQANPFKDFYEKWDLSLSRNLANAVEPASSSGSNGPLGKEASCVA